MLSQRANRPERSIMPRFRPLMPSVSAESIAPARVRELVVEMIRPAHFFLGAELVLEWEYAEARELSWEIFQGRLLDPAHTRQRRSFEVWSIYATSAGGESRSDEPLLAVLFDAEAGQLHVVRGLESYVWEGYDAGGSVYLSRERRKWVRELVATIFLDRFADMEELRDELACQLFQAVVGTSRLPLSSIESPLPAFSFGQLFYCYRPCAPRQADCVRGWRGLLEDLLAPPLHPREEAHLLETFLHAAPSAEMSDAADAFVRRWTDYGRTSADLSALLRTMFNNVSLSPFTDLVAKTLTFLRVLEESALFSTERVVDFLSYVVRQIGRHLTAYDLVLFHHRGANYPDALLLDAVLKEYQSILERRMDLFRDAPEEDNADVRRRKRLRRRALRQGWLLRRRYEGHAVPDLPTSPGENSRVLPSSHPRVPDEQIAQPARRTRRLYADDPLAGRWSAAAAAILRQSFLDLADAEEWRELGLAVFLDRPLGVGKSAAEPDATLLLSAEAFSAAIARERLLALAGDVGLTAKDELVQRVLTSAAVPGLSLDAIGDAVRPGTVSLADARRAAADFVFMRNTPSSVRAFREQFDFTSVRRRFALEDLLCGGDVLMARSAVSDTLVLYDARFRARVEVEIGAENGFASRAGQEYPVDGLRVLRVWEATPDDATLQMHDLRHEPIRLPPSFQPASSSPGSRG
jgi:hypothetical protein